MFTQDMSSLTTSQISAITQTIQTMDDLVEAASTFVLKGGQSYRNFLETRSKVIDEVCKLPNSK
jgi:hypothetical protein